MSASQHSALHSLLTHFQITFSFLTQQKKKKQTKKQSNKLRLPRCSGLNQFESWFRLIREPHEPFSTTPGSETSLEFLLK